jgi:hypothetical protein
MVWTKLKLDESNRSRQLELILALLTDNLEGFRMKDGGEEEEDGENPPRYPGKEPVDVVTDFLTGVKDYAYEAIQTNLTKALFNSLPIEVVITVPAVWSDKAKNLTFQAVSKAGFTDKAKLKVVTEPEAAAVYTMRSLREKFGQDFIKVGGNVWQLGVYSTHILQIVADKICKNRLTTILCSAMLVEEQW